MVHPTRGTTQQYIPHPKMPTKCKIIPLTTEVNTLFILKLQHQSLKQKNALISEEEDAFKEENIPFLVSDNKSKILSTYY